MAPAELLGADIGGRYSPPFWVHDRLEQVDRWLATGGW
jgi:hypothetical protein